VTHMTHCTDLTARLPPYPPVRERNGRGASVRAPGTARNGQERRTDERLDRGATCTWEWETPQGGDCDCGARRTTGQRRQPVIACQGGETTELTVTLATVTVRADVAQAMVTDRVLLTSTNRWRGKRNRGAFGRLLGAGFAWGAPQNDAQGGATAGVRTGRPPVGPGSAASGTRRRPSGGLVFLAIDRPPPGIPPPCPQSRQSLAPPCSGTLGSFRGGVEILLKSGASS